MSRLRRLAIALPLFYGHPSKAEVALPAVKLTQGLQLWPQAPMESCPTLLASGQVRFERGKVILFQAPCLIQLKVIVVDVEDVRHRLSERRFPPSRHHYQSK